MCKPKELSPVECAKRGYINTSKDTITCTHCGTYFNSSIYYESDILKIHTDYCSLSVPISLSYDPIQDFSINAFKSRESSYINTDIVPIISYPFPTTSQENLTKIFPSFPKVYLKSIYAFFGWTRGFNRVFCELCGIVIECNRSEYALVKAKNIFNLASEHKIRNVLSLRHGVDISVGKYVNLLEGHRYYCPWVNDITVEDFSYFTNESESENIGWKILLNKFLSAN